MQRRLGRRREQRAALKCSGGLVHASLVLEAGRGYVAGARISGDFFAHPAGAVQELEARLQGVPAQPEALRAIVDQWFAESGASIPGVEAAGLAAALALALASAPGETGAGDSAQGGA